MDVYQKGGGEEQQRPVWVSFKVLHFVVVEGLKHEPAAVQGLQCEVLIFIYPVGGSTG